MSIFLGEHRPVLTHELAPILRNAWWALFGSMMGYVLVLSIMLIRDYRFGEAWRKSLNGQAAGVDDSPGLPDAAMWTLAAASIASFLFGMACLAYAAVELLPKLQ